MSTQAELDAFVPGTRLTVGSGDDQLTLIPGWFYFSDMQGDRSHTKTLFQCLESTKRQLFVKASQDAPRGFQGDTKIVQDILILADDGRRPRTAAESPEGKPVGWSGLSVETLADPHRKIIPVAPDELPQYMDFANKYPEWDRLLSTGVDATRARPAPTQTQSTEETA